MRISEIEAVISRITYKAGWRLRVRTERIVEDREDDYPGTPLTRERLRPFLQVAFDPTVAGADTAAYGTQRWTGRKWDMTDHMTESELVYTAFKAILAAEEHETRELFKYENVEVCGPHFAVRDIVDLVKTQRMTHDVRPDAMQGAQ